jgi:hypothetical protein
MTMTFQKFLENEVRVLGFLFSMKKSLTTGLYPGLFCTENKEKTGSPSGLFLNLLPGIRGRDHRPITLKSI